MSQTLGRSPRRFSLQGSEPSAVVFRKFWSRGTTKLRARQNLFTRFYRAKNDMTASRRGVDYSQVDQARQETRCSAGGGVGTVVAPRFNGPVLAGRVLWGFVRCAMYIWVEMFKWVLHSQGYPRADKVFEGDPGVANGMR